jgi:tRNA(adenine34) deaminase
LVVLVVQKLEGLLIVSRNSGSGANFASFVVIMNKITSEVQATERDILLIDEVLNDARKALAQGQAGVAALLASPEETIAHGHNTSQETGDLTDHAEMVLLHQAGRKLQEMDEQVRHSLSLYVTLEPCLMCSAALSYVGIKRIVYSALAEDANLEEMIVRDLTLPKINPQLVRGPFILVPGVRRAEGQALLRQMNKAAGAKSDLKT